MKKALRPILIARANAKRKLVSEELVEPDDEVEVETDGGEPDEPAVETDVEAG